MVGGRSLCSLNQTLSLHSRFTFTRTSRVLVNGGVRDFHSHRTESRYHPLASLANPVVPNARAAQHSAIVKAQPFSIPSYPCEVSAVQKIFTEQSSLGRDRSFVVSDVGVVERQYSRWCRALPGVQPFYAVKCNPDETLLKTLTGCGAGFDVASAAEMESALSMGVAPEDIIFANPIKSVRDLQYAARMGVNKVTFDNTDELLKIKEHLPTAELVIRLLPDDSGSVMRFGVKFGAPLVHVRGLLQLASELQLKVIGTSFHIGSGCFDTQSYEKAIALCRSVFDMGLELGLPRFTFLDLGGGFPGNPVENEDTGSVPAFEKFADVIRSSLATHFPGNTHGDVRMIAEPGRYMATAYSTLFTHVQGKREEPADPSDPSGPRKFLYYINDGVYGSFNCIMFDHAHPEPIPAYRFMRDRQSLGHREKTTYPPISLNGSAINLGQSAELSYVSARGMHSSSKRDQNCLATVFGATCDSMDVIVKDYPMEELFVGDWLAFANMGAYTSAASTTFNGMPRPVVFYARSRQASPSAQ